MAYHILDQRNETKLQQQINDIYDVQIVDILAKIDQNSTAAGNDRNTLQGNIDALDIKVDTKIGEVKDYIDGTFKNGLETQINNNTNSISTLRTKINDDLDTRLQEVEKDVNTFLLDAEISEAAKDTLKEIQDYINSDVEAAAAMTKSIKTNGDAIAQEVIDRGDADRDLRGAIDTEVSNRTTADTTLQTNIDAEKNRAEGVEGGLDARLTTAESNITGIGTRMTTAEGDIAALKEANTELQSNIESSVNTHNSAADAHGDIRTLIGELTSTVNELASAIAALTTRVETLEGNADSGEATEPEPEPEA